MLTAVAMSFCCVIMASAIGFEWAYLSNWAFALASAAAVIFLFGVRRLGRNERRI